MGSKLSFVNYNNVAEIMGIHKPFLYGGKKYFHGLHDRVRREKR